LPFTRELLVFREVKLSMTHENVFVETQWLADNLNNKVIRVVDLQITRCLSIHNVVKQECMERYLEGHIPGAVYMDCIEDLTDPLFKDIFYVAPPDHFASVMNRAGIDNQTMIVCYDDGPYPFAAARFWWTLLYYGHKSTKILNGGIRKWIKEGRPLSSSPTSFPYKKYYPKVQESIRASKEKVKESLNDGGTVVIDCLAFEKYNGEIRNTWSIRKGHIPGAVWLATEELVRGLDRASSTEIERAEAYANEEPYFFFSVRKMRRIISLAGVDSMKRIITYCGKGEGACTVFLALKMIGIKDASVYDGSLAEWSRDISLPMSIGSTN